MLTYQDLLKIGDNEKSRMDFVLRVINEHKNSRDYRIAKDADMYYRHLNPTIMRAQKFLYDVLGRRVPDVWSANNKIPSRFYYYFITQEVQTLLSNGVSFNDPATKNKLGGSRFDSIVSDIAVQALNAGVAYGFYDNGNITKFSFLEFAPLLDENNGSLSAGVRFWQLDNNKPLYCTLYEIDGFTEYCRPNGEDMRVLHEKRPYILVSRVSEAAGEEFYDGFNYPKFPIVPMYNTNKQSELVGGRETIDAYDLQLSALINNMDDANIIYWVIKNAGGMDDMDDQRFMEKLKTLHVVHTDSGEEVDAHTIDVPFQASEVSLDRLRSQLFDDFMALNTKEIANGAITATQIKAAYEPLNSKISEFEKRVSDFIIGILELAGIDDIPTYNPEMIVNQLEKIQTLMQIAAIMPEEYVVGKILEIFGDIDKKQDILDMIAANEYARFNDGGDGE